MSRKGSYNPAVMKNGRVHDIRIDVLVSRAIWWAGLPA